MTDHITVVGTIATVPERRQTQAGIPVANFRLATTERRYDDKQQNWIEGHTNWYSVTAYRGLAEHILASLGKGQRVIVSGRFRLRAWESGDKRGTDAEIDASSCGPDLLWGTASFTKDAPRQDTAAPRAEETPGGAPLDAGESAQPALVGAGVDANGWSNPGGDTQTPF